MQKSNDNKKVKVYTTTTCADCVRTKEWFRSNNINFEEINIENDMDAQEFVKKQSGGFMSVPVVISEDKILIEPSISELEKIFL